MKARTRKGWMIRIDTVEVCDATKLKKVIKLTNKK
jgi:hypothetical protein